MSARSLRFVWLLLAAIPAGRATPPCWSVRKDSGAGAPYLYEIHLNSTAIGSHQSVNVALQSAGSDPFQGYLIAAFDHLTDQPVGSFSQPVDGRLIDCFDGVQNAVAGGPSAAKRSVDMTWTPPEGYHGDVIFRASVVGSSEEESPAIGSVRVEDTSTSQEAGATITEIPVKHPAYRGCGSSKGCFGYPDRCVDTQDCSMMVTYRNLSAELFQLELLGQVSANQYVAVGFSEDRKMGDDSVVECVYYGGAVNAYRSFNVHHENYRNADNTGLSGVEASYVGGSVYCKVNHVAQWTIDGMAFDLFDPYHLLLALGPTGSDNIREHRKEVASKEALDLTVNEVIVPAKNRILKMLHGSLMVVAWLVAASVGTFLPRYLKKTWVGQQLLGKDLWFFWHRGLMACAWLLTLVAFALILVEEEGWGPTQGRGLAHGVIGCIVTGVTLVQPIGAAFRPGPNAPHRKLFNVGHALGGYLAHVLAITCIFLAVEMDDAELPLFTYWILTAHVACYALSHCALTALTKRYQKASNAGGDEPGARWRKILFGLAASLLSALTVAVVALVAGAASE